MSKSMKKILRKLLWNATVTILLGAGIIASACIMHLLTDIVPLWMSAIGLLIVLGGTFYMCLSSYEKDRIERKREKKEKRRREIDASLSRNRTREDSEYERFCKEYFQNRK